MRTTAQIFSISLLAIMTACNGQVKKEEKEALAKQPDIIVKTAIGDLTLPPPYATESKTNNSKVIGWPEGKTPIAPEGFTVTKFADGFENPRWTYIAPNNDIFVVESGTRTSKNQIIILRDKDKDGKFETREVFLKDLNRPFGMLVLKDFFYVANTDGLYRYPYKNAPLKLETKGTKILELPAGGYNNHWTRNIIANPEGTKIYVSVGSGSNVGENGMDKEVRRADILEINPDGIGEKIYAAGLRNPVGMDWNPVNKELWTAVNERDELGDDLVPDYITSVKRDAFYGWPYSYYGNNLDPRMKGERKDLAAKSIVPDVPVGAHTASLGLAFYNKTAFPEKYRNGAFVGQHGSWNRAKISGYKVVFVPFANGKPSGKPEDFLTGFISNADKAEVYGRPVAVTVMQDGSLLVNDDSGNTIWKVTAKK
ncbi:sorbosone dehydrogenase family protein [Flavobacterium sp. AC]|uniref:Sorbosone dehydrogenase family protein n=1 Tax=Flavobacterium azizsancarii TaxID=2961580 RepID=A0ABT4W831_9FLAO|nr:sorbosone dehydrogenase family protein [Flavobacterium azizsancarii]MDA6068721.1 sorbosone dehydrogenase family protein [Flavobacterium azizsancarii]